jgi:hypothetical protein
MAIDFMIMPFSRYLSGDFITPAMTFAWAQGVPYAIVGPDGVRKIEKGSLLGGPDAAARRQAMIPMLSEDLDRLPSPISSKLWNEASSAEPRFHRVDPQSYGALCEEAASKRNGGLFGFLKSPSKAAHVTAAVFLPCEIDMPFPMPVIFERMAGSVPAALLALRPPRRALATR